MRNDFSRDISGEQWRALFAAQSGYMLDAMDVLLYVFAVNTLRTEFHLDNAQAGFVSSVTLICSAVGGIVCGMLADRLGRTRTLVYTILLYLVRIRRNRPFNRLLQSALLAGNRRPGSRRPVVRWSGPCC